MNLLKNIRTTIETYRLIQTGDTVIAGVSGGADSVALLEALDGLRRELGLKLIVCHVNHGLRRDADTDQRFVERLCRAKGLVCEGSRVSIPGPRKDLEQAAREKRFAALIKAAKKYRADSIALGHHQNDLAETVLMRIIRGSGLQGLQAILPKRRIQGVTFIRPLINATRGDIEVFLAEQGLRFRTDPTNTDETFLRNKVRHTLLNCLASKYNPNIRDVLARLSETAALDYEFLTQTAARHLKKITLKRTGTSIYLDRKKLKRRHPALKRLILRQALECLCGHTRRLTLKHLHIVEGLIQNPPKPGSPGPVDLPAGVTANISGAQIIFRKSRG